MKPSYRVAFVTAVFLMGAVQLQAQYFGRNKVQWESFDFRVLSTQHFDIYYYPGEKSSVEDVGRMAERWYERLSRVFGHSFSRKPIVLYANQPDFQQTTTTGGLIGEGTGGFTDSLQNRIVMPLTAMYADTDHVLGHEMVHVFQYDIANTSRSGGRRMGLEQLPLWMVEGLAEYLSQGRDDPQTAMWLRDATVRDKLPSLSDLNRDPRLSPYQFGQALWAYIGGRWGDQAVIQVFLRAGFNGPEEAIRRTLGISAEELIKDWHAAARRLYQPILAVRWTPAQLGRPILGRQTTDAELNIAPSISPDGRYVAFLSTRDLFSIGLYLADARTGEVLQRLTSSDSNPHIDALRFIDSAGTWSPDGGKLAFVVTERGDNRLAILDVESRKIERRIKVPGVEAMTDPSFSPDGQTIAFSGESGGVTDLFLYDLRSKKTRRLTSDAFGDIQPAWSPDGRTIAFVSDRGAGTDLRRLEYGPPSISLIDVASGAIRTPTLFRDAKAIDPKFAPGGNGLYFLANPGGVSDVFLYDLASGTIERVTKVPTGVSGITELSPAISVSQGSGRLMFSVFEGGGWNIYSIATGAGAETSLAGASLGEGGVLPPFPVQAPERVAEYLEAPSEGLLPPEVRFPSREYSPGLRLTYVGPAVFGGVGVNDYGFGLGGSVSLLFSDVLGRQQVGVTLQGGASSGPGGNQLGGEVFYLNQKQRLNWGADALHLPFVTGVRTTVRQEPVDIGDQTVLADVYEQEIQTVTIDQVSALTQYPLSLTRRVEAEAGYQRYGYDSEIQQLIVVGNQIVGDRIFGGIAPPSINLYRGSMAFVGDNSYFGFVSPIKGVRYRYEVETLSGDLQFETGLADYRRYFLARPVTFAFRGVYFGRFGTDAENPRLAPLYLGQPTLVRGYEASSFSASECTPASTVNSCPAFDRLIGSRIAVGSAEVRVPLLGNEQYGLINAPYFPTELAAFVDVGAAWTKDESPTFKFEEETTERVPVVSAGVSLRVVLGGYLPLQFYYAKPFQRPDENWVFGFYITPGW